MNTFINCGKNILKHTEYQYKNTDKNGIVKNGIFYRYDKTKMKDINFIKHTKKEFMSYFKCIRDLFGRYEYDSSNVSYIIKINDKYLFGNITYIFENMVNFIGEEYTYLYENKQYTKSFSKDIVIRYMEIYCILMGYITIINPYLEIDNVNDLMNDIKTNIHTDKTYNIMGNILDTAKDKELFCKNGRKILSILNKSENKCYVSILNYYNLFKITKII